MKKLLFVLLVLSVFTIKAQVPSYVPTNGLVAYYPFNGNANDASGNGNNGVVNGATLTIDRFGNANNAYGFNGNNNISIPHNNSFNLVSNYTISVWYNTAITTGAQDLVIKGLDNDRRSWWLRHHGNDFGNYESFATGADIYNRQATTPSFESNVWVHLCGVLDDSLLKIYKNGVLKNTVINAQTNSSQNNFNLIIGKLQYGSNTKIDDVSFYNRALTQSEITQLYNANTCIANITTPDTSICRGSSITLNAAAVNSASVTDINGNIYPTVNIGSQSWMQKNLNVSKYKNGDIIPQVTNATQWAALTTGAWCWYNNDSATYAATYGKLYNWYAVNDPRGLAPEGWHVPSETEWNKFVTYLDPIADTTCLGGCNQSLTAGGYMKTTTLWTTPNTGATNSSGFSSIPSGVRSFEGLFNSIGGVNILWSTTEFDISSVWYHYLYYINSNLYRFNADKKNGFSVRALRNTPTYLWSTGATTPSISVSPTLTTKYYCTVSDGVNTCKDSVTVTVSTITTNLITADTIKVCGTSTTISATTGLTNYAWSNGANTASTTVTSSGWYKCTVSNGACTAVDSVYVSLFNPKITQNDTTVCAGTPLTLTVNNNTALTSSLPANLRNGLVGYWPFNGNANDESGNGNNGTVNGATLTSDRFGNVGKAYYFNYFDEITTNFNSISGSQTRSISFWLKNQNRNKTITPISYGGSSTPYPGYVFNIRMNRNEQHDQCGCWPTTYEGAGIEGAWMNNIYRTDIGDNLWHNFVYVVEASNSSFNQVKIYKDGLLISAPSNLIFDYNNNSSTIINTANSVPLKFGRSLANQGYPNDLLDRAPTEFLDDISIFNRALSAIEIQQLYSPNSTSYLWSTTATTQSINVTPTATTSYIATVSNGINTCKDTVKITVANITSLAPANIFGAVDVCSAIGTDTASIPVNYKINKIANAASYVWTVPAGATLLSGQGDTTIMVRFSSSFVSGAITVKSVSTCNVSSALKSVTVYKRVAAVPTAIQKEFTPTSIVATTNVTGLVSEVYRIKKVLYATSYNWYLNRGTNATITHINTAGENDTAVIVTFASCFVKDTLSVKSVTPCSISTAKTVIMSANTIPATVAGITTVGGDFAVCIGTSKTFTAIASTPSTTQTPIASFRWTKPVNTTITSATSDSSSITVSFNTGFTGGSLTAKGVSSCGVVGTTATAAILQYLPPTPLSIGSSTNSYNACINSSVTYTALVGTATTAQAPAISFRWTRPNNTSITSASADSSSITVRFNTGYTGGAITVKSQSRCGTLSAARSQTLTHTGCAIGTKMSLPITTNNSNSFEVSLYPNPTANAFKLLIKNSKASGLSSNQAIVKVIDIQGRMIKSFQANTNQVISIGTELKPGVYMVEVRVGEEVKVVRAVKF